MVEAQEVMATENDLLEAAEAAALLTIKILIILHIVGLVTDILGFNAQKVMLVV